MNYTQETKINQVSILNCNLDLLQNNLIFLPSGLKNFINQKTSVEKTVSGKEMYMLEGKLQKTETDCICPVCGSRMHMHGSYQTTLRHISFGSKLSCVRFQKTRYYCVQCGHTKMQNIPFKAKGHNVTSELLQYVKDLLAYGFTLKEVVEITGVNKNVVKSIDFQRLKDKYTINGKKLIQPEQQARYLGIDEFKLHNGHKYATIIIDMETGHVIWIACGKKKAVVYSFIDHVGLDWMAGVEAVACDMNSDFQEAFEESCPHIQPVFDYFHIVKNFNDKVISAVRKDEQKRLLEDGNKEAASALKKTRYILTSSRETLQRKDAEASEGKVFAQSGNLFPNTQYTRKFGYVDKYEKLIQENKLFFTMDLIKEKLSYAYKLTDESKMAAEIIDIMDLCKATGNKHFLWFKRLLSNHFEGIIAHATYNISAGRTEGTNNKIKTLRRQGYGYPDDEYFFLKIMDASRREYIRNPQSHKKRD